jgi:hypothetical protein
VFLTSCANTIDPQIPVETPVYCTPTQLHDGIQLNCTDGSFYTIKNGKDGSDGKDGISCNVERLDNGVLITCGNSKAILFDGKTVGNSIIEIINPCGDSGGAFDELLFRLDNDKIYAVYYDGTHGFLTEIVDGSYVTTDGKNCYFTVKDGRVFY